MALGAWLGAASPGAAAQQAPDGGQDELEAVSAAPAAGLPVSSIASLRRMGISESNRVVCVQGTVLDERLGEYIVVNDGTGTLFAETRLSFLPNVKERAELRGSLVWDGALARLRNATVRSLEMDAGSAANAPKASARPARLPVLGKSLEVRALSLQQAAWQYPVKLRCVVTVNLKANPYFFAQDDTSGISVRMPGIPTQLNPGDLVEIEGVSDPGGYSPIVLASNVTVRGRAPLPEAREETIFQLATGQDGSQWIEVRGVVRSVLWNGGLAQLTLSDLSGVLTVTLPTAAEPTQLLDATVRVRGACGSKSNARRQLLGFQMYASSLDFVQIEEPGVPDPLSQPTQPIASLTQFRPRQTLLRRVNVAGVVTLCEADQSFYLQDADNAVRVMTDPGAGLKAGDYAMVAGYPALGDYGQVLRDAVFRVLKHGTVPVPETVGPGKSLDVRWQDRRIRIEGWFLSRTQVGQREFLTVQIDDRIIEANCLTPLPKSIRSLPGGSLLQLTGVYRVLADEARRPISFQLTLASGADIRVLARPSWWNLSHTLAVVGVLVALVAATTLWILVLRRQVRERTESLLQSERKFRTLVEQSLVGVYIIQEGRFAYVNPRQAEIFGYSTEEMMLRPVEETIFPEDLPVVQEQIRRRCDGETLISHYSFRGRRKDGSLVHVEVLGSRTEYGDRPAVLGTALDITERKIAEAALAEASSRLQTLLENSPDCIYFKDTQSRFVCFSKAFENLFKVPDARSLRGKTDFDFFSEEHARPAFEDEQEIIRTGRPIVGKHEKETHRDGRITWCLTTKLAWRDKAGAIIGTFGISKDVTPMKEAEARLEEAHRRLLETSRLAGMAEVATAVLHNVGNVLNSVNVSCSLVLERARTSKVFTLPKVAALLHEHRDRLGEFLTADPRGQRLLPFVLQLFTHLTDEQSALIQEFETLLTHVDHIKQIVAMQQGYAKVAGVRENISSAQLLEDALQINAAAFDRQRVRVLREFAPAPEISTEKHKVLQILVNLLRNAKEAVEQSPRAEKLITVRVARHGESQVKLQVADNGIGISAENLTRIFGHGFTTRPNGHGFGLHSSALAARELGGALEAQSDGPGRGATFTLLLPCAGREQAVSPNH